MILLQYDVDLHGPTGGQQALALLIALIILAGITALLYRSRYAGLSEAQRDVKSSLLRERFESTPVSIRIRPSDDYSSIFGRVVQAHNTAIEGAGEEGTVRFRDIGSDVRALLAESWEPVVERVPKWSRRMVEYGLALAITGAIAVDGERIAAGLEGGVGTLTMEALADGLITATDTFATVTVDLVLSFPFIETVWALSFSFLIIAADWAYTHWYVTGPLVIAGGVLVAVAEYRLADDITTVRDVDVLDDQWRAAAALGAGVLLVWVVGVVPTAIGAVAGIERIGAILGFIIALASGIGLVAIAGRWFVRRVRSIARLPRDNDDVTRAAAVWMLGRYIWTVLALGLAPILVAYVVVMFVDGRLAAVFGGLLRAGPAVHASAGLVILCLAGTVAWQVRDVWPDVRAAVRSVIARQAYRAKLAKQGMPILVWLIGYAVGYGFSRSVPVAIFFATLLALGSRLTYVGLMRLRHRVGLFDGDPLRPAMTCEVYPPLEAGGQDLVAVRVGGETWIAGDSAESVAADVATAITEWDDGLAAVGGMSRAHAAFRVGIINQEGARKKTAEQARKAVFNAVRPVGSRVGEDEFGASTEPLPEDAVQRVLDRHSDAIRHADGHYQLVYDPYDTGKRDSWRATRARDVSP